MFGIEYPYCNSRNQFTHDLLSRKTAPEQRHIFQHFSIGVKDNI